MDGAEVYRIYYGDVADQSGLIDIDGSLHKTYGFDKPGYVLIRPDTYVAHIGLQSSRSNLVEWLRNGY